MKIELAFNYLLHVLKTFSVFNFCSHWWVQKIFNSENFLSYDMHQSQTRAKTPHQLYYTMHYKYLHLLCLRQELHNGVNYEVIVLNTLHVHVCVNDTNHARYILIDKFIDCNDNLLYLNVLYIHTQKGCKEIEKWICNHHAVLIHVAFVLTDKATLRSN